MIPVALLHRYSEVRDRTDEHEAHAGLQNNDVESTFQDIRARHLDHELWTSALNMTLLSKSATDAALTLALAVLVPKLKPPPEFSVDVSCKGAAVCKELARHFCSATKAAGSSAQTTILWSIDAEASTSEAEPPADCLVHLRQDLQAAGPGVWFLVCEDGTPLCVIGFEDIGLPDDANTPFCVYACGAKSDPPIISWNLNQIEQHGNVCGLVHFHPSKS